MDIIRYQETSHVDNDCWAVALSRALKMSYDDIYNLMAPFLEDDKTLHTHFIKGLLTRNKWKLWTAKSKLKNLVPKLSTTFDEMFLFLTYDHATIQHVIYVKDLTIYSYNESDESYKAMLNSYVYLVYTPPIKGE